MANNYAPPSKETVAFLKKGIIAFYGNNPYVQSLFGLPKNIPLSKTWEKFENSFEFANFLFNSIPDAHSIEEASKIINDWESGKIENTIPKNINEIVTRYEKAKEQKASEFEKRQLIKQAQLESQKAKEEYEKQQRTKKEQVTKAPIKKEVSEPKTKGGPEEKISPKETLTKKPVVAVEVTPKPEQVYEGATTYLRPVQIRVIAEEGKSTFVKQKASINFSAAAKKASFSNPLIQPSLFLFSKGVTSEVLVQQLQTIPEGPERTMMEWTASNLRDIEILYPGDAVKIASAFQVRRVELKMANLGEYPTENVFVFAQNGPSDLLISSQPTVVESTLSFFTSAVTNKVSSLILNKVGGKISEKLAGSALGKAAGKLIGQLTGKAAGAGLAAAGAGTGAAATAWTGPGALIGAAVGAIIGKLVEKIGPWLKKNKDNLVILGGLMIGGGLLAGAPLLVFLGAPLVLAGLGLGAIGTSIGAAAGLAIATLTGGFLSVIGLPVIITLVSIPILVVIILFIINSGAYLVPPQMSTASAIVSPYIDVKKVANPAGPFQNSDLKPLEVEYTITITAKKDALSNVKVSYSCNVVKEGSSPQCPPTDPVLKPGSQISISELSGSTQGSTQDTISPTESFSFSYKQSYTAPTFEDTFVVDTINVAATLPDGKSVSSAASASIKIGKPPEECPEGWPIYPEGNEQLLPITQGPQGTYSHSNPGYDEAIDIGTKSIPHIVTSRSSGIVEVKMGEDAYKSPDPIDVHVVTNCGGNTIKIIYAHLKDVYVVDGQAVALGQVIGISGWHHLHYEFQGLPMSPPYIPKAVPSGCSGFCGTIP